MRPRLLRTRNVCRTEPHPTGLGIHHGNNGGQGATPTDAQWTEILDYLSTYLGPAKLDMNKATAADMKTYLKMTDAEAAAIVKYRVAHDGNIVSLADPKGRWP